MSASTGELLGNLPQSSGHSGMINAPWAIDQAARGVLAAVGPLRH
jgi:hypothetical protein